MSEHPIDVLRERQAEAKAHSVYTQPRWEVDDDAWVELHAAIDAALRAVEQLEQAARDAGEALRAAHDPERWGDFLSSQVDDLLVRIDAAVALFDRKKQTP